jgi:hypothetical protein
MWYVQIPRQLERDMTVEFDYFGTGFGAVYYQVSTCVPVPFICIVFFCG